VTWCRIRALTSGALVETLPKPGHRFCVNGRPG
jgi:hypothetical protein